MWAELEVNLKNLGLIYTGEASGFVPGLSCAVTIPLCDLVPPLLPRAAGTVMVSPARLCMRTGCFHCGSEDCYLYHNYGFICNGIKM